MQGWICARCGASWSPLQMACLYCGPRTETATATFVIDQTRCEQCGRKRDEPPLTGCLKGSHLGPYV